MTNIPAPLFDQIFSFFQNRQPRRSPLESYGRAAVLMPIIQKDEAISFLLTQRTHLVETHKGQISFPGGMTGPQDASLEQTALRESWEEIGLPRDKVQILGQFDDYLSVTGLIVTPFVGWVEHGLNYQPNPDEVDEILFVPLGTFRDERLLRVEHRQFQGQDRLVYYYDYRGKIIWGLTARIIRDFLEQLARMRNDE